MIRKNRSGAALGFVAHVESCDAVFQALLGYFDETN